MQAQKKVNRKWAIRTIALLLTGIALTILAARWPRERLLLARAIKVADTADWDEAHDGNKWTFGHYWLSDHEVLFAREDKKRTLLYSVLDSRSGVETPSAAFKKAMKHVDAAYGINFSPDNQWFYAVNYQARGLDVVKTDGSRRYHIDRHVPVLTWLNDSHHFIALDDDEDTDKRPPHVCVYSVDSPKALREALAASLLHFEHQGPVAQRGDHFVVAKEETNMFSPLTKVEVIESGLGLSPYAERRYAINFPASIIQEDNIGYRFSPTADRIAYRFEPRRISPLLAWLHRIYPRFVLKPQRTVELWISELDGKNMREVGHVDLGEEKQDEKWTDTHISFEWLPSGKRLAFRYKETLYTVPVD